MNSGILDPPRLIPYEPTVAWFVRDLIPDKLWTEFDVGCVRSKHLSAIQADLFAHGGRAAWLRFVEQTRAALPELLKVSIFEMIGSALRDQSTWPSEIVLHFRPEVSVHAGGRLLRPAIVLGCHVRLSFHCAGEPRGSSGDYVLADTEIALRHARQYVIDIQRGQYYVRVPPPASVSGTQMQRDWFSGFGARR